MPAPVEELTVAVKADTKPFSDQLAELSRQSSVFSSSITAAFKSAVTGGRNFETVLKSLALQLASIALDRALQPVSNIIGNAIGAAFSGKALAEGGIIAGGQLKPFARGGVIDAPTVFPLGQGLGLAGEAGAEAVVPLARGPDGRLGVASDGGGRQTVINVNITTPDTEGFRRSEAQVTAMLARAVGRGRRGL
ncbi:MAG: phage tail tape measure protein [Bauldia sp.]|nr:phage tail tape measure protein [Bauldia sp.]